MVIGQTLDPELWACSPAGRSRVSRVGMGRGNEYKKKTLVKAGVFSLQLL